ncbi:MAG: DUF4352 domain-containing protein, partial [Anaerolineae bacterium]|nr:DUF4352 domain-containing protein [Anaerolineae bacterium]
LFLAFVTLAVSLACNGGAKETPVVVPSTSEEAVATGTTAPPTQQPPTPTPAPVGTSPNNPVPLGSSLTAEGAKITIKGIVARGAEATAIVTEWNTFNPEPSEGKEYVIISGNVAYEGGKEDTLSITSFDFRAVVKGVIVDAPFMLVGDELLQGEMFAGGSIDGYLVFEVDEGATGIMVIYTVLLEESYYFATE